MHFANDAQAGVWPALQSSPAWNRSPGRKVAAKPEQSLGVFPSQTCTRPARLLGLRTGRAEVSVCCHHARLGSVTVPNLPMRAAMLSAPCLAKPPACRALTPSPSHPPSLPPSLPLRAQLAVPCRACRARNVRPRPSTPMCLDDEVDVPHEATPARATCLAVPLAPRRAGAHRGGTLPRSPHALRLRRFCPVCVIRRRSLQRAAETASPRRYWWRREVLHAQRRWSRRPDTATMPRQASPQRQ